MVELRRTPVTLFLSRPRVAIIRRFCVEDKNKVRANSCQFVFKYDILTYFKCHS